MAALFTARPPPPSHLIAVAFPRLLRLALNLAAVVLRRLERARVSRQNAGEGCRARRGGRRALHALFVGLDRDEETHALDDAVAHLLALGQNV